MIKFQSLVQAIHQGVKGAAESVEDQNLSYLEQYFDQVPVTGADKDQGTTYKPKTYAMEFPSRTANGVETVVVNVPLITLTPVSVPKVESVKFTTELEISCDEDDELVISFPSSKTAQTLKPKTGLLRSNNQTATPSTSESNAKIEISLTGDEPPEGLRKLIAGYERALRAQLPG